MLLGSLMTDKSLTFLYGRFGVGKSALAFQIAFAAATGDNLFELLQNGLEIEVILQEMPQ